MILGAERPGSQRESQLSLFTAAAFTGWLAVTASWWVLAFAPLPIATEWLRRTRAICFGTLDNGLPDTWGWMLLVLGPLSVLAFLVAVWGRELAANARWLARRPGGRLVLAVLGLALAASSLWLAREVGSARRLQAAVTTEAIRPFPSTLARGSAPAPALALVDQHGALVDLAALRGRPVLVTFVYAHCVTVCPRLAASLRHALSTYPAPTAPALLVVTLDPWRDTPRSLPGMLEAWGLERFPATHALSGEVAEVEATRVAWSVEATRDPSTGQITHLPEVFVVDGAGRLSWRLIDPSSAWIVEALRKLDA